MPRGGRGGPRAGTPGTAYPNRSDLNSERSLPVRTVPGQTYGAAEQQQNAQRMVPMAAPSIGLPPAGAAGPMGAGGGAASAAGAPPSSLPPGALTPLDAPSERPDEPVTHGAALGPGPGPDTLPGAAMTQGAMTSLLSRAALATGSAGLASLAAMAANQGH